MPIRFRCGYCKKLLGIARRKAGTRTTCPHCGATITVPVPEGEPDQTDLDEIDALLKAGRAPQPTEPPRSSPNRPQPRGAEDAATPPGDPPLFERDLDDVLGMTHPAPKRPEQQSAPPPAAGMDATSLANTLEPGETSSRKATAIVVCVVVLLGMAFAAGFLIASR